MQHNDTLQIIRPDDWHLHVRSGEMLKSVIGMTASQMGRAIIMPNLTPPVSDAGQAQQYHQEILNALPTGTNFTPLMVLYLTDNTTPEQIQAAVDSNDMLVGGIKPHYFCLPILKRENPHQKALLSAATSGNAKFFLGTDSAPHAKTDKESSCGCAGILSAHCAIELYASAFESQNALDKLEGFASIFGADFYGLAHNTETITLKKQDWVVPDSYSFADTTVVPFMAGKTMGWKLVS